jgi:hypothetical protein
MNLRVLPGLAHSCQTLDAFSISIRPSAAVSSRVLPYSIQFRIVLFRRELRFQVPTGSPVGLTLERIHLWKQVQKEKQTVDITIPSA